MNKPYIFQNGLRVGTDFIPVFDNLHWEFQDTLSRTDTLRQLQRKFSTIQMLNRECHCRFNYFEEIPFSFDKLSTSSSKLAMEIFSIIKKNNDTLHNSAGAINSNLLVLENRNFDSLLRLRNQFFPLDLTFLKLLGFTEREATQNLSPVEQVSLFLKESFTDSLISNKVSYLVRGSEILLEDMKMFKAAVLDSDMYIDDEFEFRLRKYVEAGGTLIMLRSDSSVKPIMSEYLLKPELSMNVSTSYLLDLYELDHGIVVCVGVKSGAAQPNRIDLLDLVSKSTGLKFGETRRQENQYDRFQQNLIDFLPPKRIGVNVDNRKYLKKEVSQFIEKLSKNSLDTSHGKRLKSALDSL